MRPSRPGQGLLVTVGLLALMPALVATGLRVFPPTDDGPALVASFIPYGLLGYLIATLCLTVAAVRARGRRLVLVLVDAVAVGGLLYHAVTLLPLFVPDRRPVSTAGVTVFSLNMRGGGSNPAELTAAVQDADLVVLAEATPEAVAELDARGWQIRYPYVVGSTMQGWNGSVVYSRYPLSGAAPLPDSEFQQWRVTVATPQIGRVQLLAVHPCNPFCGANAWIREHRRLQAAAEQQDSALPLVIAGDFNAVVDHGPMRQLRAAGLRSATDLAGAGWLPTYPANRAIPPLLPIDHILVNDRLTATAVGTVRVDGTDHLAIRAVLAGTG